MKKIILIAALLCFGKAFGQSRHEIEWDRYEKSILKDDSTLLAKTEELASKLQSENNMEKRRQYEQQMHSNCRQLKRNVDELNRYQGDKIKRAGDNHHYMILRLKQLHLDLEN